MASLQVAKATSLDNKDVKQPQNGAQATVLNQTKQTMILNRSFNWSGTPAYPGFPLVIQANNRVMFNHLSDGDFGSSAAVIYYGYNLSMEPCAWVLAWDAPAESEQKPNRVYVTCGSKSQIDNMEFSEIRKLLSESPTYSKADNHGVKTTANATINDRIPNKASLGAGFGIMP